MTSAKAGTIVPHVAFMQRNDGVSSWKTSAFTYDIAYPERVVSIEEIEDIINEVMIDDVYRLQKNTQPSDIWIDVGSHVGFFSIAAMQAGARVYMAIEADPDIVNLKNAIAAIASRNNHPLSVAVSKHFSSQMPLPEVCNYKYYNGMGMEAGVGENQYLIGSRVFLDLMQCTFSEDARKVFERIKTN